MTPGSNARPDLPLALIVGAGGIGMVVARRLGQRHRLMLADRDPDHLQAAVAALAAEGHDAVACLCDVTSPADVTAMAGAAAAAGPLRTLAHVVGLSPSVGDWRAIMAVDLVGAALVEQAIGPVIAPGGAGVFVSSLAAHGPAPAAEIAALMAAPLAADFLDRLQALAGALDPGAAYSHAKWALNRLCRWQAGAWAERGARIVSLSPGLIASPMGAIEFERQPAKLRMLEMTPVKREGTMIEIAGLVDFLASDAASFLTGVDILADGGLSAAMERAASVR